jgi:peptidoglycan/LPS O-acetylase OafA/YrhL
MSPAHIEASHLLALAYALAVFGTMLLAATMLVRIKPVRQALTSAENRYGSLDGLRGILASGVFIHHSVTAYLYFTTGQWKWGENSILNQLGQSTVALFFMITAFLFTLKAESLKINWKALYISRIARLLPLYAVVVALVFVVVFAITDWQLRESLWTVVKEFFIWITFLVFKPVAPDVNGFTMTWTLIAGVNWSLRYEVIFYVFAVPVLHAAAKLLPIRMRLAIALAAMGSFFLLRWNNAPIGGSSLHIAHFLAGVVVAYAFRIARIKALMSSVWFRALAAAAGALLLSMTFSYSNLAILCTTLVFAGVVGGASIFGLLNTRPAIWLGDISYGIYLCHGLTLWLTLFTLRGVIDLSKLGLPMFIALMIAVSAVVVILASLSYVLFERPVMLGVASRSKQRLASVTGTSTATGR